MAELLPNTIQRYFDSSGNPLVGGQLFSYQAGTTTPLATYTDQSAATPNANPTILDSTGSASIWIPVGTGYKFVLEDSLGNVQWTKDNVYIIEPNVITSNLIANGAVGAAQIGPSAITTSNIQSSAITSSLIATGAVIASKIPNGTITAPLLDPNINFSSFSNTVEVVFENVYDLSGMRIKATPQYPWSAPALLGGPGNLPASAGESSKFSPCGRFLAVASNVSPFVIVYERGGSTFYHLQGTPNQPTSGIFYLAWSPNGDFLAVGLLSTPFIMVWQRQGDFFNQLANPATLPTAQGFMPAFSPNGEFLALTLNGGAAIMYQVIGTQLQVQPTIGGIGGDSCAWTPDSKYFFDGKTCYERLGAVFTAITGPAGVLGNERASAWSPDGEIFAIGTDTSPYIFLYSFSDGSFTALAQPATIPSGMVTDFSWSKNSQFLALSMNASPYVMVYNRSNTTFTALASPANLPASAANSVGFSPTTKYLAVATTSSPYIYIYESGTTSFPQDAILWARNITNV